MSDDYIDLVGTVIFTRPKSVYIRFDGIDDLSYKGQFVGRHHLSPSREYQPGDADIDIRVKRYYYKLHIAWRLYGNKRTPVTDTR